MSSFDLQRLGQIMAPEPGNHMEVEGVLNPAAVHGPDGQLYLFPRLVAKDNYSHIGIARVKLNDAGDPCGVEQLGIALVPEAEYEQWPDGRGGSRICPHYVRGAASALCDDLHWLLAQGTAHRAGDFRGFVPLEAAWTRDVRAVSRH